MFRPVNIIGITLFFILGLFSRGFCEESMTITTYYPSPYGSYNELTTTGNTYLATSSGSVGIGIGTTSPDPSIKLAVAGAISANGNRLYLTGSDGGGFFWINTVSGSDASAVIGWNNASPHEVYLNGYTFIHGPTIIRGIGGYGELFKFQGDGTLIVSGNIKAGGGSGGKATCWKSDGITIGHCLSAVNAEGSCTCD